MNLCEMNRLESPIVCPMITEADVLQAYQHAVRLKARQMLIEKSGREETDAEAEERLDAICDHSVLELQYVAQFTY